MSKLPETLIPPVLPHPMPGFWQRLEANVMALNLLELMSKCDRGQYNAEVYRRASYCLDHELAAISRHKTNIVWA